jgi:hypothetical protein
MPKARSGPGSYKALTTINLPFTEVVKKPGDEITAEELEAAQQDDASIQALVDSGAIGGEDDELHPSTIIPDPGMPTIQTVVTQARQAIEEMEAAGDEIPPELKAVAELDYTAVTAGEEGSSSDSNA